ncbi:hypothetical protein EGI22_10975 [Lacihabitans sp. LS3-19]|uniref:hypothetical protein n=1 Tax=Lacihabitans sp. LS3-19 TaxID=2487335 RepID=UPI0020CD9FC6|nr:hypothetical protein [Lacihabitans sp. LS3-19]MCP9768437.1 hypothetical protein [Lacihabitans sp. LS3-19]
MAFSFAQSKPSEPELNNTELEEMMIVNQKIREYFYEGFTSEIDEKHRLRAFELLADRKVITKKDKFNAAILRQNTDAILCDGKLKSLGPGYYYLA